MSLRSGHGCSTRIVGCSTAASWWGSVARRGTRSPGCRDSLPGYLSMAITTRECSAVTGACLATRRPCFDEMGGFDESLGVDLNDVDYCLRAAAAWLPGPVRASAPN